MGKVKPRKELWRQADAEGKGYWAVIEFDDIQWAIVRNGSPVSFHVFSASLRRRLKSLSGIDMQIEMLRARHDKQGSTS